MVPMLRTCGEGTPPAPQRDHRQFARTSGWAATSLMRAMALEEQPRASVSDAVNAERLGDRQAVWPPRHCPSATASDRATAMNFASRFAAAVSAASTEAGVSVEMPACQPSRAASRIAATMLDRRRSDRYCRSSFAISDVGTRRDLLDQATADMIWPGVQLAALEPS